MILVLQELVMSSFFTAAVKMVVFWCLVRFESSEFYHEEDARSEGGSASFSVGSRKKVVVVYWMWSGGVGCFVVTRL